MKFIMRTTYERKDLGSYFRDIPDLEMSAIEEKCAYKNFQNALKIAGEESALHLEDDIILCDNFLERIMAVVEARSSDFIQFYSGNVKDDFRIGTRYERGERFCMAQCFYTPKGMSAEILKFSYTNHYAFEPGAFLDLMVAEYLKARRLKYLVVCPSLVDHKVGVSLIDPKRKKRTSKNFIGGKESIYRKTN